jgi:uncharacterized protein (TIGR03435 family)
VKRTYRPSCFVAASLAALLAVPAFAENSAPPAAAPASFEVSTVKLNTSDNGNSQTSFNGGTFVYSNMTLKNSLIYQAFGVPKSRIVGGPNWLDTARFDIQAKMDPALLPQLNALPPEEGKRQFQAMFQQLLADRFQLKSHWETRELPVYALVVANPKSGPTLHPPKDPEHSGTTSGMGLLQATNATLPEFAEVATQGAADELGRVVIDKTGIAGKYDILLKWTPVSTEAVAAPGPSIFTAIQEQLGLKLEPTKGPVRVLVIDSVQMPSAN